LPTDGGRKLLNQVEDFIYKIPIILLFAVPVILVLILVIGPIFRKVRYNRWGMLILIAAIAASAYLIAVRFNAIP
jgi:hypothetical protein